MRSIRTAAAIFFGMILLGCGSHEKPRLTGCGVPGAQAGGEVTLAQSLAELDALPAPAGVKDELFQSLKDSFRDALTKAASGGKFVCEPPDGDLNKVNDLRFHDNGDGTYNLRWSYRNIGDYNQDGIVDIKDITPLAVHFNESVFDHPESDPVDGNGDTVVDIKDITPLAAHFNVLCSKYSIEGAGSTLGPWDQQIEVVPLTEASEPPPPGGRKQFDHLMSTIAYAYFRVVPQDDDNNSGIPSDAISGPGELPRISSVSPTEVPAGSQQTFSATVSGSEPLTYEWDFDDAGAFVAPSTASDAEPVVLMTDTVDSYQCSLTVTNDFGDDTSDFTLNVNPPAWSVSGTVTEPGGGPGISDVTLTLNPGPLEAVTGGDGTYAIADVGAGDYTLTPSKAEYVFDPPSRDVTVTDSDVTGQDFTGEIPPKFTVSGHIEKDTGGGLAGVNMSMGGGLTDVTNGSGDFAIADVPPGDYILTPGLFGYSFTPTNRNVEVVDSDVIDQNFIAEESPILWQFSTVDDTEGIYKNISLMDAGGKPGVAYSYEYEGAASEENAARFARNSAADGLGSWTVATIEEDNGKDCTANYLAGAMVGGHPAVVFNHEYPMADDHLKYSYNSAPDGSGSWNGPTQFDAKGVIFPVSLADVGGLPVISYCNASSGQEALLFASNSAADGSGTWTKNTIESGSTGIGYYNSIANVGGKPAAGYYFMPSGQTYAKFAINSSPNGSGTWTLNVADPEEGSGNFISIAEVAGKPAVAYKKSSNLYIAIAANANGSGAWTVRVVDDGSQTGGYASLAVIGGQPGIAYYKGWPDYNLMFAINSAPSGLGTWSKLLVDDGEDVGKNCSLAEINGKPAIAYWDYANRTLKYAIMP